MSTDGDGENLVESFQNTINSQEHVIEGDQNEGGSSVYPSNSQNKALYDAPLYTVPIDSEGNSGNIVGTI